MFEQKIKPNRKKNLSSKIIVDQYDHLIKNSKIQPNYDSFLDPPLSPHFMPKDSKFVHSKEQSSQSEYSMHHPNEHRTQAQCYKCGEIFAQRIIESHMNVCEKKPMSWKKEEQKACFNKKDQYNLFSMNQSVNPDNRLTSARSKVNKIPNNDFLDSKKGVQLKKSTSKKSIHSLQKNIMKRPTSSTRNKVELKGHQNLKEKILNKLQGTRRKNPQSKQDHTKRVSSSQNKNTSSNSRPKSINKNVQRFGYEQKKFSTINSSSINKKKLPSQNMNYEFNRSQIMSGFHGDQGKKEKAQFISKANIKEEKKQTLKKKTINYNNSFAVNQTFQRQKQKSSKQSQHFNFTENNSYVSATNNYRNAGERQKQVLRQQLRKQGLFRRDSSSSASKRKYNRELERQNIEQKPFKGLQQVNDEYYFFQNHPSSVPSHYIKREDEGNSRYEHMDSDEIYQNNSSNIIRNKLGINKNLIKSKETGNSKRPQQRNKMQTEQQIRQHKTKQHKIANQLFEKQIIHRRTNSSRQNNRQQRENQTNLNTQYINGEINRGQRRQQARNVRNEPLFPVRNQNQQSRQRPNNPMGNDRLTNNRRQNINRPQNRPQPRITNQRMNSSHNQNQRVQNQQNQQNQAVRNQTNRNNLQNQQRRPQTQQRRRPQQQRRRQQQQPRQQPQQQNRRQNAQNRRQNSQQGTSRRQNRRPQGTRGNNQRIQHQTLNFISNTLNEQFEVMKQEIQQQCSEHFNFLNNVFSNFSNIVNVNITASTNSQNPTTFVFRNHGRRRNRNNNQDSSGNSHSQCSDFSSDFSQDESVDNQTDYDEDEYFYQEEEEENPGMTEHEINSIPVLRYKKEKHGSNQCTICLVQLNQNQPFKKLFCDHVFHTQCIDEWLKRKNACPVCRDQMGVRR